MKPLMVCKAFAIEVSMQHYDLLITDVNIEYGWL